MEDNRFAIFFLTDTDKYPEESRYTTNIKHSLNYKDGVPTDHSQFRKLFHYVRPCWYENDTQDVGEYK